MKLIVTARHAAVTGEMNERAQHVATIVEQKAHRPHRLEVIFDIDHDRHVAELRLHTVQSHVFACHAEADDFRTALDRAEDKLRNHLDKDPMRRARDRAAG
jgi:ribosome-associated translation inhibitor RaiA